MELVDLKVAKPDNFHSKREKSWKTWARQFDTYCNVRKDGVKKAFAWAKTLEGEAISDRTIDQM